MSGSDPSIFALVLATVVGGLIAPVSASFLLDGVAALRSGRGMRVLARSLMVTLLLIAASGALWSVDSSAASGVRDICVRALIIFSLPLTGIAFAFRAVRLFVWGTHQRPSTRRTRQRGASRATIHAASGEA
jgi:hypothetical protein